MSLVSPGSRKTYELPHGKSSLAGNSRVFWSSDFHAYVSFQGTGWVGEGLRVHRVALGLLSEATLFVDGALAVLRSWAYDKQTGSDGLSYK